MNPTNGDVYAQPNGNPQGQAPVAQGQKPLLSVVGEEIIRILVLFHGG
ncbi:MAG: hypothetical protein RB148_09445 [Armatimonadota bacterium]|nr:hypothetical protein [Armatimonadota bacterium]